MSVPRGPAIAWVAGAGMLAGLLDITYAWLFWYLRSGTSPSRIFQSVAAGLLGSAAFTGGAATAGLGLALHFAIALTVAFVYYAMSRRIAVLWQRPWLCGIAYGAAVYCVMNFVVVPLSAAGSGATVPLWTVLTVIVHMVCIGWPCALAARAAIRAR